MNVSTYGLNVQYQKTQLSYDMTLSKVDPNEEGQELLESNSELSQSNFPIVYMSEDDLNNSDIFTKMILEAIYSQYATSSSSQSLIPNIKTTNSEDIPNEIQAYTNNQPDLPMGVSYTSSSEYYEKTTLDFSGEIRIKTPEGEYSIELNLSYTQEFYEKNASFIEIANERLQSPLEIELSENNENLKDFNTINLLFDTLPKEQSEEENNFFAQLIEYLQERNEYKEELIEKKKDEEMDNYKVYMSKNEESYQLISSQKDGLGVFFSQSNSESSYLNMASNPNGSYISAGYSSSQTTTIASFETKV